MKMAPLSAQLISEMKTLFNVTVLSRSMSYQNTSSTLADEVACELISDLDLEMKSADNGENTKLGFYQSIYLTILIVEYISRVATGIAEHQV